MADLYKAELTIPLAFRLTAESREKLESRVRAACRDLFYEKKLLARLIPDIDRVVAYQKGSDDEEESSEADTDPALPGELWSPDGEEVPGGVLYLATDRWDDGYEESEA